MPRPASGSPTGSPTGRVADEGAAKLLLDERTRDVLGAVLQEARSASEVAGVLGRGLDDVLYRLRRLEAAGLVDVVERRRRGGRPVKVYRSPREAWFVPFGVLPFADVEETLAAMHHANAARLARASARHLVRTPWAGFLVHLGGDGRLWLRGSAEPPVGERVPVDPEAAWIDAAAGDGPFGLAADVMLELRLSAADTRALQDELLALVARYRGRDDRDAGPPNRLLAVVSVPLDEP